jgi:putative intracellular protease/amidase
MTASGPVLFPIPSRDFDPTEVAVSWKQLTSAGHRVSFATPDGRVARGDDLMLTGEGLDPWSWVPGLGRLVAVGRVLRADARARAAYEAMADSEEFGRPIPWDQIESDQLAGILLAGGHRARGMREYLESPTLQAVVVDCFRRDLPVAAVCHGVLLAARSVDPETGRSVLHGRRTTSLTWTLEHRAWAVARRTRFWDPDYYRTYLEQPGQPAGYMSVQAEVIRNLARPGDYRDVPTDDPEAAVKNDGRHRDGPQDSRPAFLVRDGWYVSARWPGDVHTFAHQFGVMLDEHAAR